MSQTGNYARFNSPQKRRFEFNGENTVYPYGKHSGKTLKEIMEEDLNYLIWLKTNNSIDGLDLIINTMLIEKAPEIEEKLNAKLEKLHSIQTLKPYEIVEMEIEFEKNLRVYVNEEGKELFAYYKYYYTTEDLILNIIFPTYKKYNWQGHEYALPTNSTTSTGKRLKGNTIKIIAETREPYIDKRGNKMVQNLIVRSF